MPRPATGQVVETNTTRGQTFALRFRAYGARRFVTLPAGTSRREAETELQNVMADVLRGDWRPAGPQPIVELPERQGFHEFASAGLARRQPELRPPPTAPTATSSSITCCRSSPVTSSLRSPSPRSTATGSTSCARA